MDYAKALKDLAEKHQNEQPINRNGKVLLVDGLNSYLRCFSATNTMNDDGKHVGGITGFLQSLALTIRTLKPTRVVVVFDGAGGSLRRRKLFPEYKDNRRNMTRLNRFYDFQSLEQEKESIDWQRKILVYLLRFLPVTVLCPDNVEADDVLAYLAQVVEQEHGGHAIIMSTDKDFLQLVNDTGITVWNPVKKKTYNTATVLEDYGFHPHNFLLYRCVTGDASDNIPGVMGVKEKTLLKFCPALAEPNPQTIDSLLDTAQTLAESSKKVPVALQTLLDSRTVLKRNHALMRLDDVAMSVDTRVSVLKIFNEPIPPLDKFTLTKLMINAKMISAFGRWDEWIQTSFVPLMRYSGERHV